MTDNDPSSTTPEPDPRPVFGPPNSPQMGPPVTPAGTPNIAAENAVDAAGHPRIPSPALTRAPFLFQQPAPPKKGTTARKLRPSFSMPASPLLIILPLLAAIFLDIASHSSWSSVSGFGTIVLTAAAILLARHRAQTLTSTAATSAALAVAAGINIVLRSALVVTVPTWIMILALLFSASVDLPSKSTIQQVTSFGHYLMDIFRFPSWLVFSWSQTADVSRNGPNLLRLLRGVALAATITVPVIALLASGDAIFASLIPSVESPGSSVGHVIVIAVFFPFLVGLVISVTRPESAAVKPLAEEISDEARPFPLELLLVFAGLVATLTAWCAVQLVVISEGDDIIFRTAGLTRADYAREGFFQLVAVAAIVVAVIAIAGRFFKRSTTNGSPWSKVAVGVLTIETMALTAVALSKMNLYIGSFGLTGTRLSVSWFLVWLFGTLLIVSKRAILPESSLFGFTRRTPRPIPLVQAFGCAMLILFGLSNPDHFVASTNLSRDTTIVALDQDYLLNLSSDATPVIVANLDRFDEKSRWSSSTHIEEYCSAKRQVKAEYGLLGWNYGRSQARVAAAENCAPLRRDAE